MLLHRTLVLHECCIVVDTAWLLFQAAEAGKP